MSICLLAIFKNESHIIEEFVKHYLKQGVSKFFFTDNSSNDDYRKKIQTYIDDNVVDIVVDNRKHLQIEWYNNFLSKSKQYDWAIVVDLDEFVYARNGFKTIKDYLLSLDNSISQIFIPWKLFGSNGFKEQPTSVIESFTKRANYNKSHGFHGVIFENEYKYSFTKCIVRTKYLKSFGVHSHDTTKANFITSDNIKTNIHKNNQFSKIDEHILNQSHLHINHYVTQSLDWFMKIKATRGDVHRASTDNLRNIDYFNTFDNSSNDIDDYELKNMCST